MAGGRPILHIRNALKRAADGHGSGTRYGTATGAPGQDKGFFGLSGVVLIADVGADAANKFRGSQLYFPGVDERHTVTGWTLPENGPGTLTTAGVTFTVSSAHDLAEGDFITLTSGPQNGQTRALIWRTIESLADILVNGIPAGSIIFLSRILTLETAFSADQAGQSYRREHRAGVVDMPQKHAVGACELRRALHDNGDMSLRDNGLFHAIDGYQFIAAKVRAANVALTIDAYLPNLIGQAGFEELTAGALPSTEQAPGIWWSTAGVTISATTPLLGSRMATWNTVANDTLQERLVGTLKKGKTYRLIMKVQAVGGATATDALRVTVVQRVSGANIDADFGGPGSWNPGILGTAAAWITSPNLVPDADTDAAKLMLSFVSANKGAATAVRIDEVYLWEVVNVASLVAFNHNWDGSPGPSVTGYRCPPDRTGIGSDETTAMLAASAVAGSGPLLREFTAAVFPIYRVTIAANASYQYQVGELLLAEAWPWLSAPRVGMAPQAREYHEQHLRTISGAETRTRHSVQRKVSGTVAARPLDLAIWNGTFRDHHVKDREPFAAVWPGHWDTPLLWYCTRLQLPYENPVWPDATFEFEEAL